jgi:hypothetical protein
MSIWDDAEFERPANFDLRALKSNHATSLECVTSVNFGRKIVKCEKEFAKWL